MKIKRKKLKNLRSLKTDDVTIYLCPSAGKLALYAKFYRLMTNFTLAAIEAEPAVPKVPVCVAIDELPVIGFLKSVEALSGYIRGFHAKFYLITQNLKQLQKVYPNSWENLLGNNICHFYANANSDLTSLKFIEEVCGKTAVETVSKNVTTQSATGNNTVSYAMHPLITTTEASRIFSAIDPLHRKLIIWGGHGPIILQRVRYWDRNAAYAHYFDAYWRFIDGKA